MPCHLHVRTALQSDTKRLAVLATQVWLHTYATEGISQEIADYTLTQLTPEKYLSVLLESTSTIWVVESGDALLGFAVVKFGVPCPASKQSSVELQTLYVQAHFVGQGIGKLLLQTAEDMARSRAGVPLWLTVNARNSNAIAFYRKHRYQKVGTTHFVLGESRHENHVLMGPDA